MPRLQPGLVRAEYPTGETPQLATTFIRQFLDVRGDFPPEFHAITGFTLLKKRGGARMVGFSLTEFEDLLLQAGLYWAVRAVQYGIPQSIQHFYAILEHTIQRPARYSLQSGRWGLPSMRRTKSQGW